jgi:anti-anti-sigma factor
MRRGQLDVRLEAWQGAPVIKARGEVGLAGIDAFRTAAQEAVRGHPRVVIFDLRDATLIDSSGLGVLIATRRRLGLGPDSVIVVTENHSILSSLQITGLDRCVRVLEGPGLPPLTPVVDPSHSGSGL